MADDLTGACDSGLEFARKGLVTRVAFSHALVDHADVVVINTDSRRLTPEDAAACVRTLACAFPTQASQIVFKKIDSTLRGHVVAECNALREAAQCGFGVIAPALPAQGRIIRDGTLIVHDLSGTWSLDIRELLAGQGVTPPIFAPRSGVAVEQLAAELEQLATRSSSGYVLCDSASEQDLECIAAALIACHRSRPASFRPVWIGSAGLAKYAAAFLARSHNRSAHPPAISPRKVAAAPVLLCIGSDHPTTNKQIVRFLKDRPSAVLHAATASPGKMHSALIAGSHLILMLDTQSPDAIHLRQLLTTARLSNPAAILITGGDTAELVCRATHTEQLLLEGELVPGVALGLIEGGLLDGLTIATKSGGFGIETCLVEAIDALSVAPNLDIADIGGGPL